MRINLRRRWPLVVLVALVLVSTAFVLWATIIPAPMPEAMAALTSDSHVSVRTAPWLVFEPANVTVSSALILYPGGRVDARAYAPAARAIAADGFLVVVVPMPLNLAVFGADRAGSVIDSFPLIDRWAIGGHSLGGSMAAQFARRHQDRVAGLVLWASYPAGSDNLTQTDLRVTSISADQDGLSTPAKIEASRSLLPADTTWVVIEGGNHAQFGWYGTQSGDGRATISREAQLEQVVAATTDLLRSLR